LNFGRIIDSRSGALQFDDDFAALRSVQQRIQLATGAGGAAQSDRNRICRSAQMGLDLSPQIAAQFVRVQTSKRASQTKEGRRIGAFLNDAAIGFAQDQQCAMWLYRAREMDLLTLAIR
jgi:hypothetical protein